MCVIARDDLRLRAGNRHERLLKGTNVVGLAERQVLHRTQHASSLGEHEDTRVLTTVRLGDIADLELSRDVVCTLNLPVAESVTDDLGLLWRAEAHDLAIKLNDAVLIKSSSRCLNYTKLCQELGYR